MKNLKPITYNLKPSRGFTLVEMLVSIAVLMVVMTVASGSLMSIIDGDNKAQSLKSAINNLNFAIESMAKNIRVGTDYSCVNCSSGDTSISFISSKKKYVTYRFNGGNSSIERCVGASSYCVDSDIFTGMTAKEVKINDLKFYTVKGDKFSNRPGRVLITVSGEAGAKEKIKTKFNLQTTVSQRSF
ncbi:MAG: type II secretion system protein [Patescibacteria group bacterium]|nr:type II secretion system protein [Patescibacteria group bacterium]